jgi:glycosyltransferase involved in cell wall biosynthesis
MNIFIIGAYPPPIGGITVHVKRLHTALKKGGYPVEVFDFGGKDSPQKPDGVLTSYPDILRRIINIGKKKKANTLVHIHVSAMGKFKWFGPLLIALFRKYPKVITIHSGSFIQQADALANPVYIRWLLGSFDQIITVSQEQKDYLRSLEISEKKVTVIPAFLSQELDQCTLPKGVEKLRDEKEILVITSGYLTPIYNYEILIDVIEKLPSEKYGFIFAFYTQYDPAYQERVLSRLSDLPNTLVLRDQTPEAYLNLLNHCDIYVRGTLRDGDSVAIREALQMGKTVFATDAVQRPKACQLFSVHDTDCLIALFRQYQPFDSVPSQKDTGPSIEAILKVYQKAHADFPSKRYN